MQLITVILDVHNPLASTVVSNGLQLSKNFILSVINQHFAEINSVAVLYSYRVNISKKKEETLRATRALAIYDKRRLTENDSIENYNKASLFARLELENSDLIDKKVIKRATESTLILDPEMTLSEEVSEYLTFILELPQDTVERVLKEMQNYADKLE